MRCGLDLRDLGGALSYRRLALFLASAPQGSEYKLSRYGRAGLWTQTDYILADLYDLLRDSVNWEKAPPRYPRPDTAPKEPAGRVRSLAERREWSKRAREGGVRWWLEQAQN
jgi:hypothetical protein